MAKQIKFQGQIHQFPDNFTDEQISSALKSHVSEKNIPNNNTINVSSSDSLGDVFKNAIANMALNKVSQSTEKALPNFLQGDLSKGFTEGFPQSLTEASRGIAQLGGSEGFPETQIPESQGYLQSLGRGFGKTAGYGAVAAPFIAGGEAAIPGIAGSTLGAASAGGLTHEGNYKDRLTNAFLEAMIPAGLKGLKSAGRIGLSAIKRSPTPRKAADILQEYHAEHKNYATKPLDEAEIQASKEKKPIRLNSKLIDSAEDYLAKTKANKNLIKEARKGDYKSVFKLQSDLGKRGESFASKNTQAEIDRGSEIFDLRDSIIDGMKTHYDYLGHPEVSKNLTEGRKRYADFADLFLKNPTVSKLVGKEKIVPKNLLGKLESDTAYFDKLRKAIPEIEDMLKLKKDKKTLSNATKRISRLGFGALISKGALPEYKSHE